MHNKKILAYIDCFQDRLTRTKLALLEIHECTEKIESFIESLDISIFSMKFEVDGNIKAKEKEE